jgi:hypothetical protein
MELKTVYIRRVSTLYANITFKTSQLMADEKALLDSGAVTIARKRTGRTNHPERTTMQGMARTAARQKRHDESTFSARLAEALRRHRVAVRTTRTSSSMMRDIMDQLA